MFLKRYIENLPRTMSYLPAVFRDRQRWVQAMQDADSKGLDKLSDLAADLEVAESELGEVPAAKQLQEAREEVVASLILHRGSLYRLDDALSQYRAFFKAEHMWLKVLDKIATAYGCSAKKFTRLLEKYDTAGGLGPFLFDKMLEQRIDPRLPRNRLVVEMLEKAPKPADREAATAAVKAAKVLTMKRTAANSSQQAVQGDDAFACRIKKLVDPWYHTFPLETRDAELRYVLEKLVNTLRADVRELRIYSRPDQVRKPAAAGGR